MRQALHSLTIETRGKGLVACSRPVLAWVAEQGIATGLLTLWCQHTSASLLVQENASPEVQTDIAAISRRSRRSSPAATSMTTRDRTTCRRICARC